jgi:uncharacterized phage infection (PIP) family protein YhgE
MDPEIEKRFENIERQILATANIVRKVGMPSLIEAQMRIDALMDSDTRLYGTLQELAEAQKGLTESQKGLTESHKGLAEAHKELAASQKRTDEQLDRLAASVQAFIDSLRKNGNGSKH